VSRSPPPVASTATRLPTFLHNSRHD